MDPPSATVRLSTLGALSARRTDAPDSDVLVGQPALVFAYLIDRGAPQPRSELTTLFWPESDGVRGRHGLRQALSRVRKSLGGAVLTGTDPVGVDRGLVEWDVDLFERALERGDLSAALDLWRGPFLNGAAEGLSWEAGDWLERRRRELDGMLLDAGRGAVRGRMMNEDFESALALVARLQERLPGDRGLIIDSAELLIELGRPHEAEARLAGSDIEASDARVAGLLKRARRTTPEPPASPAPSPAPASPAPPSQPPASPAPPPQPAERPPPAPPPEPPTSPLDSRRGLRTAVWLGAAAMLAVALIGFFQPAPMANVSIWFCMERETRYGFVVELPERSVNGVLKEPGCPIIPLGGDSVLVVRGYDDPEMRLELETGGHTRVVYRAARIGSRPPFRSAGVQDGMLSADQRTVLLGVERPERTRATDPTLEELPDEGPIPGVAELRRDPPFDWDVVVVDVATGEARSIGRPEANLWDARFTPDGDAVVYASDETGGGDLYRTEIASGATTRLTRDARMARYPVVGRRWTVFMAGSATEGDPEQIMVLNNATGELVARFPTEWNQSAPDLSPDERYLCWTSKQHGHWESEIMIARVDGRGAPRSLTVAGRDDYCHWASNDHVLYRSWRTGSEELFIQGRGRWDKPENLTNYDGDARAPFVVGG